MKRASFGSSVGRLPKRKLVSPLQGRCYCSSQHQSPSDLPLKKDRGFWLDINNQRAFLDQVATQLNIKQPSDWYKFSRKEVIERGGQALFKYYSSLNKALSAVYPEYPWQISRFVESGNTPRGYWKEKSNLLQALKEAEAKLGIKQVEDWYSVALSDLQEVGFPAKVTRTQLVQLLAERYSDHQWERTYLLRGRYGQQKRLEKAVASLFPGIEAKINARSGADLLNPDTGAHLELDIYLPSLQLAFEYQDIHHYRTSDFVYQPLEKFLERDEQKRQLAKDKGITLITVPCWWDGTQDSLTATIKQVRPDLLPEHFTLAKPIPTDMPQSFLESYNKNYHIEDIGEPITACFLTGVETNPTNWWLFEKYDGVRAFWNPLKKTFYSRRGTKLSLPQHIVDTMPSDTFLDGELWFGRDNFQEAIKISNRVATSEIDWSKFKYMVWDVPNHRGTFEERYKVLEDSLGHRNWPFIEVAQKVVCTGIPHLETFFQDIVDEGGEGVILRDPHAPYKAGRSPGFLKHKKFRDAEAKIVAETGPQQWECILPNGITFTAAAGTTEFAKRWQPKPGDIVSFKHRGFLLASKRPITPALYRLRPDLTWEDVCNNFREKKPRITISPLKRTVLKKATPKGHWQDVANRKKFFCDFAAEMGFDPYVQDNWSNATASQVIIRPGGAGVLKHYSRDLAKALKHTFDFTDVKLKEHTPVRFWNVRENRRKFFCEFAAENGFDPTDVEQWNSITTARILTKKGAASILKHHFQGSLKEALKDSFPELDFEQRKTTTLGGGLIKFNSNKQATPSKPRGYWKDPENRKKFFLELAEEKGFDPNVPANWTSLSIAHVLAKKGGAAMLRMYGSNLQTALQSTFGV